MAKAIYKVTYTVRDGDNDPGYIALHLAHEIGQLEGEDEVAEFATYAVDYIVPLLVGKITNINLSRNLPLPASASGAVMSPLADVQEGMEWRFRTENNHPVKFTIPAVRESVFYPSGDVDFSDAGVENFLTLITHPEDLGTDWSVNWSDQRGDIILASAWRSMEAWGTRRK